MITLWGPTSAGKTALLSHLFLRSKAFESDWDIFPTPSSIQMITEQSVLISRENTFPAGTKPGEVTERTISYKFRHKTTREVFDMETKDLAGIRSLNMDSEIAESLKNAEGIVLLVDCKGRGSNKGNREAEVINALTVMNVNRSNGDPTEDNRPLAVCLSKVDQLLDGPADYNAMLADPAAFTQRHLSEELRRWIDQYHTKVCYFPVSAVGIRLCFGSLQKSVAFDERLNLMVTSRGTPINLLEPFTWIFESLRGAV